MGLDSGGPHMWFSKDTISNYWVGQKLAVGQAVGYRHSQGTPTGQILICRFAHELSPLSFFPFHHVPLALYFCLPMPPSQALLIAAIFCKTHLAAGKKYIHCCSNLTQHTDRTHYNSAFLSLQYLTFPLHTRLVWIFHVCSKAYTAMSHTGWHANTGQL